MQPGLILYDEDPRLVLRGRYDIREQGEVIESFAVELEPAPDSPRGLRTVWEIGGRIPRVADPHHVNVIDGSLCVALPEAFWYDYPTGLSLAQFLDGPLRRHLAGQSLVLRGEDPDWVGIGYIISDLGALMLVIATVIAGVGVRRARQAGGAGGTTDARGARAAASLVAVLLALSVIAIWAMTTKPE